MRRTPDYNANRWAERDDDRFRIDTTAKRFSDVSQDQSSVVQTCKPWYAFATVAAGRFVRFASRVTKHGGSALPGKVVEKIDPGFLTRTLGQLPLGAVLVSGTNGKTTTVAAMLSIWYVR